MLQKYDKWDSVLMPLHAADTALPELRKAGPPVAVKMWIGIQAIKIFGKGFLLRGISARDACVMCSTCRFTARYAAPAHAGKWKTNIRTAQEFQPLAEAEAAEIRKKATSGKGVLQGNEMEYWKKGFFKGQGE